MENSISDHLLNNSAKNFLLLKTPLSVHAIIKSTQSNKKSPLSFNFKSNDQNISIDYATRERPCTVTLGISESLGQFRDIIASSNIKSFSFHCDAVKIQLYDGEDHITYYLTIFGGYPPSNEYIQITKDGRIRSLRTNYYEYNENNVIINVKAIDERVLVENNIEKSTKTYHYIKGNIKLITVFNSDKKLVKYELIVNSGRQGLFYDSDEFGNFEISCYINGILHGYYFSSFTDEQGFYENGIKVGFWEEQGKIINYDIARDRIFFMFPVFLI